MIAQIGAKLGGDCFRDLDGRKLDRALSERVPSQRRNGDAARLPAVEQRLDLPVPFHAIGKTSPTGALARAEHRPHQRKNAGRLDEQPGRTVRQMLPVQFGQLCFEIIVHQRDRQVGGALHEANAQLAQGSAEFLAALHVDRLNAHTTFTEIFLRDLRRQAEARPIGGRGVFRGRSPFRADIAAVDQPFQGFVDLVGRKFLAQAANDLPDALSGPECRRERTIEFAVKKELPVLGVEAHDIGRQHIDGEVLRELRNVFAVELRKAVAAITGHEVGTRAFTLVATSVDHHCGASILQVGRSPSSRSRSSARRYGWPLFRALAALTRASTGSAPQMKQTWPGQARPGHDELRLRSGRKALPSSRRGNVPRTNSSPRSRRSRRRP